MKLSIISDIHLERGNKFNINNNEKSDAIVLAGDIGAGYDEDTLHFVETCCKYYENVIYVLGNHEIYGHLIHKGNEIDYVHQIDRLIKYWKDIAENIPNLHFLNNNHCIVNGRKFIGSTLFSDIRKNLSEREKEFVSEIDEPNINTIVDYNEGDDFPRKFNVEYYDRLFIESLNYINSEVKKPHNNSKILVTHYSPLMESIESEYKDSISRRMYASDLSSIIGNGELDMAIHGHIHSTFDYYFSNTRVICNPHGSTPNHNYKPLQIII